MITALPRPLFWTITGADFGRSIAWARQQPPNAVDAAVIAHRAQVQKEIAAAFGVPPRFTTRAAAAPSSRP